MSTIRRATSCSRSIGAAASTQSCAFASRDPANMAAHDRRCSGRHAQHGRPLVRRTYRRVAQSHGHAYRPGQDLDGAPCRSVRRVRGISRLPIRGKRWRMADHDRSGGDSLASQTTRYAASSKTASFPLSRSFPARRIKSAPTIWRRAGQSGDGPKRSPVSRRCRHQLPMFTDT